MMDWSNEMVFEFLNIYETEPILWDPKHPQRKQKRLFADAWRRISTRLSWECSIDEMKKKKDSLMAYYRIHLNKIKKSKRSGMGPDEMYTTSWFAFEAMNSFLGNIYDCATTFNTEETSTERKTQQIPEFTDSGNDTNDSQFQRKLSIRKKVQEVLVAEKQTDKASSINEEQNNSRNEKRIYECELYGKLLAHKLMKLGEVDRMILMHNIDNLVFETTIQAKAKRKVPPISFNFSSSNRVPYTQPPPSQSRYALVASPSCDSIHTVQSSEESRTANYIFLPVNTSTPSPSPVLPQQYTPIITTCSIPASATSPTTMAGGTARPSPDSPQPSTSFQNKDIKTEEGEHNF